MFRFCLQLPLDPGPSPTGSAGTRSTWASPASRGTDASAFFDHAQFGKNIMQNVTDLELIWNRTRYYSNIDRISIMKHCREISCNVPSQNSAIVFFSWAVVTWWRWSRFWFSLTSWPGRWIEWSVEAMPIQLDGFVFGVISRCSKQLWGKATANRRFEKQWPTPSSYRIA